jgi:AcrR family transcriptional regulator
VGSSASDLSADEIVRAAVEILHEHGLDAVSMRTVAARLGVSPVPLYRRVGNKEALLDAVADQVLADAAPVHESGESWQDYTMRWASELRQRVTAIPDLRRLLTLRRSPFRPAATALVRVLRAEGGFTGPAAVEAVQLLTWAAIGAAMVGSTAGSPSAGSLTAGPVGSASAVPPEQSDRLFTLHVKYIVEGVERDAERISGR